MPIDVKIVNQRSRSDPLSPTAGEDVLVRLNIRRAISDRGNKMITYPRIIETSIMLILVNIWVAFHYNAILVKANLFPKSVSG
jgi:hypothetical protein